MDNTNTSRWSIPSPKILCNPPIPSVADFEFRLQHFLRSRQPNIMPKKPKILSQTKASLNHIFELIHSVQHLSTILADVQQSMSDKDWEEASTNVVQQQKIVVELLEKFSQLHRMQNIKKAIKKRRKKRKHMKIKEKPLQHSTSTTPTFVIDTLQPPNPTQKSLISTHKSEANSFIALLDNITELHKIRSHQSGRPCHTPSTLLHLSQLWANVAEVYEQEERTSLPPLKETPNEATKRTQQMWKRVLFGPTHHRRNVLPDDNPNLERLIEIRKSWDAFLVGPDHPFGSSIPVGFVIPRLDAPTNGWAEYLVDNCD